MSNEQLHLFNPRFGEHGYIQVYTGDGKGKTTASLGLTLRALGRGWRVLIVMFTKGGDDYGELVSFANMNKKIKQCLCIVQAGSDRIVYKDNIQQKDKDEIKKGWDFAKNAMKNKEYEMIILDEANIAIDLGLIPIEEMIDFLKNKPDDMEIVLTGRNAHSKIIEVAHLVSEIKPIKHYWDIGVKAREGIEY